MKVYETDKQWRYPHMVWDSLPQASASQVHPHAHLLLNPVRHYGEFWLLGSMEHWYLGPMEH